MNSDHGISHQELKKAEEYLQTFLQKILAVKKKNRETDFDDKIHMTPLMQDMLHDAISNVLVELQQLRDMVLENKFKNKNSSNIYSVSL